MNVPKLRFPEFSGEWEESELGKYAEEVSRINPASNAPIMMISAASGFILQSNKYSKEMAGQSLKKYIELHLGEFAYNHGASKIKKYGACFSLDIEKARIPFVYHCFKLNTGNTKFFAYLLNRNELDSELARYISSSARMDGLLNISYSDYMKIKINVPSLPEQQKIVDFLSTVDSIIASETKVLNALQKKKKTLMQKLFSQQLRFKADDGSEFPEWEESTIEKECDYVDYRGKTPNKKNEGIFLVTAKNIKLGYIDYECSKEFISEKDYPEVMHRGVANIGDVLITTEAPCGNVAQVDRANIALAQRVIKYSSKGKLNNTFLKYYFLSDIFRDIINQKATGSTVKGIKGSVLHKQKVIIPCLQEQQKIADCLSSLDNLIQNQQKIVTNWQQRKKGLLQQMFV